MINSFPVAQDTYLQNNPLAVAASSYSTLPTSQDAYRQNNPISLAMGGYNPTPTFKPPVTSFTPFTNNTTNMANYSKPNWNQFLASPQASMGGGMGNQTPLQTGAKINQYMDGMNQPESNGLFSNFNPMMTGFNMLMNNQPYTPSTQDILGLFTGKM